MKKFTKVVLLSSAIVFPVKLGFSTPKESVEDARRKRIEVESVQNILASLPGSRNISDPPPPGLDTKDSIKVASLSTDSAPPALHQATSETAPAKEATSPTAPETTSLSVEDVRSLLPSTTTEQYGDMAATQAPTNPAVKADPEPQAAPSPSTPVFAVRVSPSNESFAIPPTSSVKLEIKAPILAIEMEKPQMSSDSKASASTTWASELPTATMLSAGPATELSLGSLQGPAEPSAPVQDKPVSASDEPQMATAVAPPAVSEPAVQEPAPAAPQEPIAVITPPLLPAIPVPAASESESQPAGPLDGPASQVAQPESKKVRVRLTFYTGKDDHWGSRVAWGKVDQAKRGRTAAADPTVFPYGTWIDVPGFGKLRVEDTGTAVKARKASGGKEPVIDIYIEDEDEAERLASSTPDYVEITLL